MTYAYDGMGRKKMVTFGSQTLTYDYDGANQVTAIEATTGFMLPATFDYFDNGVLRLKSLGNGTRTYYFPDGRGRTTYISHRKVVGQTEQEQEYMQYTYDGVGNVKTFHEVEPATNVSWLHTYDYDWANRLVYENRTGSGNSSYDYTNIFSYDGNGNRTQVSRNGVNGAYSVTDADRLTSGDGYTFQNYDAEGNPGTIVSSSGTLNLSYKWFGKVTQITPSSGPVNTFLYDGIGRRVRKTDSQGTTSYVYDGSTVIGEVNTSGAYTAYYTPGIGFVYPTGDVRGFYQDNDLGSTLAVSNYSGDRADRFMYDAFGITSTLQQNVYTPHKFAGGQGYYSDGDTGMLLLGQRYYLPKLGRFLTEDPAGLAGGLNLYAYAGNNPLSMSDPSGMSAASIDPKGNITYIFAHQDTASPEPETPGYFSQAWGFFKGELRAANPINWVKGLWNAGCVIKQRGWAGAKDVAAAWWDGVQFWNKENPEEAGESFMGDVLMASPLLMRMPSPLAGRSFWASPFQATLLRGGRAYANLAGRLYTRHALERMAPEGLGGRGVPPSVVENAIRHGSRTRSRGGRIRHEFENVTVITEGGIVITVVKTGR